MADLTRPPSFCIATPTHSGNVECGYALTVLRAALRLKELGWLNLDLYRDAPRAEEVLFGMGGWTANARNNLVARVKTRPNATHILFIDSDIIAPGAEEVERLCRHALEVDVVGEFYPKKRTRWDLGVNISDPAKLATAVCRTTWPHEELPETETLLEGWGRRVQVTDYLPAGFMAVRVEVFDKMRAELEGADFEGNPQKSYRSFEQDDCFSWFDHPIVREEWWGEDVSFCRKWRALGGEVWKLVDARLAHVGKMVF